MGGGDAGSKLTRNTIRAASEELNVDLGLAIDVDSHPIDDALEASLRCEEMHTTNIRDSCG